MFNQGDILIVPFPFSDLTSVRQRPVLVLSKKEYNEKCEDIVTCGITSNLKDSKYSVLIDNPDLIEGNIPVKSRIKTDRLFTLEQSIIIKKMGMVNKGTFSKVRKEFINLI
ncbi:MazF family transcriptional regulator [Candidatus Woesearchaeota archaeon CG10_big_fil_rev_8_21_14_0_10_34_12]|nr:MAG: MazF family transcriptional regulator [Candidatus Woesearchaeota archaeon CG10_big_fil_rev_8_21_14_0_10_34_12]